MAEHEPEGGEQSFLSHLIELRERLLKAVAAVLLILVALIPIANRLYAWLALPLIKHLPQGGTMIATEIASPFLTPIKLAFFVALFIAMPFILYQLWAFISPALTRRERKYALPFTLLGVGLFFVGITVGFIVLRYPIDWLVTFGSDRFLLLTDADSYFTFVTYFLLAFAIVFELPLVLTFMSVVGIISSTMLRQKRMVILFGLWFLSCFITPGADPFSPVIIGVSFTVLFELSILLMRAIGR